MQDIHLENIGRGPVTLVLPHDLVCSEERCLCSRQRVVTYDHNPQTGDRAQRARSQRVASSIQLFAGHKSEALPSSVLRAPDVAKALKARAIKSTSALAAPAPIAESVPAAPAEDMSVAPGTDDEAATADTTNRRNRNRS